MALTLHFTAGLPGAGKSTYINKVGLNTLPIVDPDQIKADHPDYDPKAPEVLHEWSKRQARLKQLSLMGQQESFVVDGTGTNVEKYLQWFQEAREVGYKIVVHYVKVPTSVAIERNRKRERTVPMDIIVQKSGVIDQSIEILSQYADETVVVDGTKG